MKPKNYLQYSGMALQMGLTILLGVLAGRQLDKYMGNETPIFTIVLALLAIFAALYLALKDFLKDE